MQNAKDQERLLVVDAVRALALFGVLVMNLRDMAGLNLLSYEALMALQGPADQVIDFLLKVLFDEKSLSAFSFLFGLSFSLILQRKASQPGFLAMYARRLLALAGFGLINIAFFYWADILLIYALFGAVLVLCARLSQRTLLRLAGLFLLGGPLVLALLGATQGMPTQSPMERETLQAFASASYWATVQQGVIRYFSIDGAGSLIEVWDHTNVFGMFLLGLWSGRARIPHRLDANHRFLQRVAWVCLPMGLVISLAWVLLPPTSPWTTLMRAGAPILAVGYMALAALLLNRPGAARIRALLAAPGRLALTNYLGYGLLGQALFYGWAMGNIGHTGSATIFVIAVLAYAGFTAASRVWLRHFRMGLAEWLWRCLTYQKWQPFARSVPRERAGRV